MADNSRYGKYLISAGPTSKRNRIRQDLEQYRVQPDEFIDGNLRRNVEDAWTREGRNAQRELSFYDRNVKNDPVRVEYEPHEPTWSDRGKEVAQGLAGFAGGTVDLGNEIANLFTDEPVETDYRTEWKNIPALRTKNKDMTSYMLRGAGEFAPEIIPAAGVGKGAKAISKLVSSAKKGKKAKAAKKTLGSRVLNILDTPITPTNVAGFAGAGAAHGALHSPGEDGEDPNVEWYQELPAVVAGGIAGSSAAGRLGSAGKSIGRGLSGSKKADKKTLGLGQKMLINRIDSYPGRELDNEFIQAARKSGVDLNALNIYKDNIAPYSLAKKFPNTSYEEILPGMAEKSEEYIKRTLDSRLMPHDLLSNPDVISENLSKKLNEVYKKRRTISSDLFDMADKEIRKGDVVIPEKTINVASEILEETQGIPGSKNTDIEQLGNIAADIKDTIDAYINKDGKFSLKKLVDARKSINRHLAKTDSTALGRDQRSRIAQIKAAIDEDIHDSAKAGILTNKQYSKKYNAARKYLQDNLETFDGSKLFKRIVDDKLLGEKLDVNDVIKKALNKKSYHNDLESLIESLNTDSPYLYEQAAEDLKRLKRLNLEKKLFGKKKVTPEDLLLYVKENKYDPIYSSTYDVRANTIPGVLDKNVVPVLEKHKNMGKLMKDYKIDAGERNGVSLSDFRPRFGGAVGGGLIGQSAHPTGALTGALTGAVASGALLGLGKLGKEKMSDYLYRNLSDQDVVKELIKRGNTKYKKPSKGKLALDILGYDPVMRTQGLIAPFRKDERDKWGE